MVLNCRKISFDILYNAFYKHQKVNEYTNQLFDKYNLNNNDKSYVLNEVKGIIENVEEIDKVIDEYSKVKTSKLDRDILLTLRIGAYELLYFDKVPNYAIINECVNIVKFSKNNRLSGYVNAILHNIANNYKKKNIILRKNCYFRIMNSMKEEVLDELNALKITYSEYDGDLNFKYTEIYKATNYKDIIDLNSFKKGYIMIQDASSIFMTDRLVDFTLGKDNIELLDTCASPGGKVLGLIDTYSNVYVTVMATAADKDKEKVDKIKENKDRYNIRNLDLQVKDATVLNTEFVDKYDVVICDVPCSGLGVINKKPDIRLNFSNKKQESLIQIQKKILSVSSNYVKIGGILSYSTCTTVHNENDDVVNDFLQKNCSYKKIFEKQINIDDNSKADGFYMCFMMRVK